MYKRLPNRIRRRFEFPLLEAEKAAKNEKDADENAKEYGSD